MSKRRGAIVACPCHLSASIAANSVSGGGGQPRLFLEQAKHPGPSSVSSVQPQLLPGAFCWRAEAIGTDPRRRMRTEFNRESRIVRIQGLAPEIQPSKEVLTVFLSLPATVRGNTKVRGVVPSNVRHGRPARPPAPLLFSQAGATATFRTVSVLPDQCLWTASTFGSAASVPSPARPMAKTL